MDPSFCNLIVYNDKWILQEAFFEILGGKYQVEIVMWRTST